MNNFFLQALRNNKEYDTFLKKSKFKKGQIITNYIKNRTQLFIIEDGSADLMRHDYSGNKIIVDRFYKNDIFGEIFYNINTNNELFVVAKEECTIYNIDYKVLHESQNNQDLIKTINTLFLNRIINQNSKLEILSRNSIREKLLAYFSYLSSKNYHAKKIKLPFSCSDLAAYLTINRSAMMREIKNLIDEGFITKNNKYIELLY